MLGGQCFAQSVERIDMLRNEPRDGACSDQECDDKQCAFLVTSLLFAYFRTTMAYRFAAMRAVAHVVGNRIAAILTQEFSCHGEL